jgi:AAA+ ATPase superfamily predicted ATPase
MREFIGRSQELAALTRRWQSPDSQFVVVYGRRRVGKTELIRRFASGKHTMFCVGSRSDSASQISHFMAELGVFADDPGLSSLPVRDWDVALERLTKAIDQHPGKSLVVFDEFQWLADAVPHLSSLMQKWWDTKWSKSGKLVFILCGSYLGFMEREILGHKSPLFGRRTGVINLQPLTAEEAQLFHTRYSLKDRMRCFLVCGGIPAYHKQFSPAKGMTENLVDLFFSVDSPLAREADFLLMEELREPKLYFSLLETLGSGRKTVTDLSRSLGVERSRLPYYAKSLIELHYVEKSSPLLHYGDKSERKVLYRISDPLLRFWFTFVYPNANALERLDAAKFFGSHVAPYLDSYMGTAFEPAAAEIFARKIVAPSATGPWKMGTYWDKHTQIDFTVALASGFTYLGEVKWGALDTKTTRGFVEKLQSLHIRGSYRPLLVSMEPLPPRLRAMTDVDCYDIRGLFSM